MIALKHALQREWLIVMRNKSSWLQSLVMYALVVVVFPLALDTQHCALPTVGFAVMWFSALWACSLLMMGLFRDDFCNGILQQYLVARCSLIMYVWLKVLLRWVLFALPLVLLSPVIAYMYAIPSSHWLSLTVSLIAGTLSLTWVAAVIGSMFVSQLSQSALLLILLFPLYIPVLVFGVAVSSLTGFAGLLTTEFAVLMSYLCLLLSAAPGLIAWILKAHVSHH